MACSISLTTASVSLRIRLAPLFVSWEQAGTPGTCPADTCPMGDTHLISPDQPPIATNHKERKAAQTCSKTIAENHGSEQAAPAGIEVHIARFDIQEGIRIHPDDACHQIGPGARLEGFQNGLPARRGAHTR